MCLREKWEAMAEQLRAMTGAHFELVPARKYYGKHATGAVLLRNGYPEYHGERAAAKRILATHLKFMKGVKKCQRAVSRGLSRTK
jgi:hypothetical protein